MSGKPVPPKPWERHSSQPTPRTTPAEGLPKPWESPASPENSTVVPSTSGAGIVAGQREQQQQPLRPWERPHGSVGSQPPAASTSYGGYGSMYGRSYGGYGSGYGLGAYGGGGTYGSGYGGAGMYGSGYGGMYGRPMYGGGGGMYGGGYAPMGPPWDPNDPNAPAPPSAWQAMLAGISGIVHFFGRLSFLVDENAHAVHFFISALLQLLDRFGSLYGELARFVLRMLGFRPKDKMAAGPGHQGQGANFSPIGGGHGPTTSSSGLPFDKVWGSSGKKIS